MIGGAIGLLSAASNAAQHPARAHPCTTGHAVGAALGNCFGKATAAALSPYLKDGLGGAIAGGAIALAAILLWHLITIKTGRARTNVALRRLPSPAMALAGHAGSLAPPARQRREPIPERVRHEVWRRDEGCCVDCGSRERLEFDHIIPVSRGGSNTARNVELRCEACNRGKGNRI